MTDKVQTEHLTSDEAKDISIASSGTTSPEFRLGGQPLAAIYYDAPSVAAYFTFESAEDLASTTWRAVKNIDGTTIRYPFSTTETVAGCIGADALVGLIGLDRVRIVASATQTSGWAMHSRTTG